MNDYEAKKQARIDRYKDHADNARDNSRCLEKSARQRADMIPFGQPILVGHHSEKRDRNFRAKIHNTFQKSAAEQERADYWEGKAEAAENNRAVSSDDPEAVVKLKEQLEQAEKLQERMKAANKIIRRMKDNPAACVLTLQAEGFKEDTAQKLLQPDFCGRIGFPDYAITNNGANIRRLKARIDELGKQAGAEYKETTHLAGKLKLIESPDQNRVQLIFDSKPDDATRDLLKHQGFRWSPMEGAWQRHLNNAGRWAATWVIEQLEKKAGELTA